MTRPNRVIVLLIGIILVILILSLTSCRLTKQERQEKRDSKLLEKIQARSPGLFESKTDTVIITDSIYVATNLQFDTTAFREELDEYLALHEAKKRIAGETFNIEQRGAAYQTIFNAQQRQFQKLLSGGFIDQVVPIKGKWGELEISFNPKSSLQWKVKGFLTTKEINTTKTITIKEFVYIKPKRTWMWAVIFSLVGVIIILALIKIR